ncbi:hypothetical protein TNCT_315211 [Trichonephila clavata]|uniref:Uncharacterized protein n=1 Tax=Trichonephila clavata TaxID=2740835 RepID=A0A8X6F1Z7_TRICU|nr:hypothetical protein TNCT_315211 [Trichonephila clavata]
MWFGLACFPQVSEDQKDDCSDASVLWCNKLSSFVFALCPGKEFNLEGTGDFYFLSLFLVCRFGGCVLWFWHLLSPVDSSPSERIPRSVRGVPSLSFPPVSNLGSNASPSPLYLGPDHRTGIAMG